MKSVIEKEQAIPSGLAWLLSKREGRRRVFCQASIVALTIGLLPNRERNTIATARRRSSTAAWRLKKATPAVQSALPAVGTPPRTHTLTALTASTILIPLVRTVHSIFLNSKLCTHSSNLCSSFRTSTKSTDQGLITDGSSQRPP